MSINLKIPDVRELKPRITVFGTGGAGGNAVNNMITSGLQGVDFVVANTDAQALTMSKAERIIQMGVQVTEGLGAGSQPEVGRAAAEEVIDEIRDHLPSYEHDGTATLAISVGPPPTHKVWATESGFLFPVLSDFWPHGGVAQAYGVFNDDAGFANRGTFVVDRAGIVRFAEMKQPGEPRDQAVWTDALAALRSG